MFNEISLQQVSLDAWPAMAGMLAFIAAAGWLGLRQRGALRVLLLGLTMLAMLRLLLVGNPVSWQLYAGALNADQVGWRQRDLIRVQRDRFMVPPGGVRYLAVGSSQTEAVYDRYARMQPDFDTFIVAAMMPMDFVLYSDDILRRRPEVVLLYLSDFDIAKKPSAEATVVSPRQGFRLVSMAERLRSRNGGSDLERAMVELAFGELLPEFKHRYVFRGLVDEQLQRIARRLGRSAVHPSRRSTEEERIRWLRESLSEEYIAFNLAWLEDFLTTMDRNGIEVIMVEGHYHPAVSNAATAAMKSRVLEGLETMAGKFESVQFMPRGQLHPLTADDYRDLTHVTPAAGEQFTRALLERIRTAQDTPGFIPPGG